MARRYHGRDLRKGRYSKRGNAYLLTTVTHRRESLFTDVRIASIVAREISALQTSDYLDVKAWVLMPDHLHLLAILKDDDLAAVMRRLKSLSAIAINRFRGGSEPVWQKGFHDRAVRAEEDLRGLARYVIANPLRAGLVERVGDYPFWNAVWL